jgi:hypothetical protein
VRIVTDLQSSRSTRSSRNAPLSDIAVVVVVELVVVVEVTGPVEGNRVVDNAVSQLYVIQSHYTSEENCFANGCDGQLVADFTPFGPLDRYPSLADYQKAKGEDMHSRAGSCGTLPPKFDVHALHAAALAYPAPPARAQTAGVRGWLDWVLRR